MKTKKDPVFAEDWQLQLLMKSHQQRRRLTEEQKHELAVVTGLDEGWIRNWFSRQNSRSRKAKHSLQTTLEPTKAKQARSATPSTMLHTFHLSSNEPTAGVHHTAGIHQISSNSPGMPVINMQGSSYLFSDVPSGIQQDHCIAVNTPSSDPPRSFTQSPSLGYIPTTFPLSLFNTSIISSDRCSIDSDISSSTGLSTNRCYSRDPLHNRYPDFSKFFLPSVSKSFQDSTVYFELSQVNLSPVLQHPPYNCSPDLSFGSMQSESTTVFQNYGHGVRRQPPPPLSYIARLSDITNMAQYVRDTYLANAKANISCDNAQNGHMNNDPSTAVEKNDMPVRHEGSVCPRLVSPLLGVESDDHEDKQ